MVTLAVRNRSEMSYPGSKRRNRQLRYSANLGRYLAQDDLSLQVVIEWEPQD